MGRVAALYLPLQVLSPIVVCELLERRKVLLCRGKRRHRIHVKIDCRRHGVVGEDNTGNVHARHRADSEWPR